MNFFVIAVIHYSAFDTSLSDAWKEQRVRQDGDGIVKE
jgi:hypothetical protein